MTAPATQQVEVPHGTVPPLTEVKGTASLAKADNPFESERKGIAQMPSENEFAALMQMADMLSKSGFMPAKLNTAGKVLAVILTGRELGLPPMLSTRSIKIMEDTGLPIVAADVLLGAFKRAGGKSNFTYLDDKRGILWLRHPNGDEYTETFTIEDAKRAGLTEKKGGPGGNNWIKWPKQMIRSRCITGGLKSLGWEPAAGVYDADEAEEIAASTGRPTTIVATVSENGGVQPSDTDAASPTLPAVRIRGVLLDQKKPDSTNYEIGLGGLVANMDWGAEQASNDSDLPKWERFINAIKTEIARRYVEEMSSVADDESAAGAVDTHYQQKLGVERYNAIIARIDEEGHFTP
jgi:hypothetical protein